MIMLAHAIFCIGFVGCSIAMIDGIGIAEAIGAAMSLTAGMLIVRYAS